MKTKTMIYCYKCNTLSNEVTKDLQITATYDTDSGDELITDYCDSIMRCIYCGDDDIDTVEVEESLYSLADRMKVPITVFVNGPFTKAKFMRLKLLEK